MILKSVKKLWYFIYLRTTLVNHSSNSKFFIWRRENIVGASYHPSWITFLKSSTNSNDCLRVITYINTKLIGLWFLLRKNIFNYWDINLISFFNCGIMCFIINMYSDKQQNALKYLKNTEVNLNNISSHDRRL